MLRHVVFCFAFLMGSMPSVFASTGLCSDDEISLFTCNLEESSKSVAICQSKSDKKAISYKYGVPGKVEISLPNEKSGKPYIHYEQFGPSTMQWFESIVFPVGKIKYSVSTPQGIAALLHVEGIKNEVHKTCETGDSGPEITSVYETMDGLGFEKK